MALPPRKRRGQVLTARDLNAIRDAARVLAAPAKQYAYTSKRRPVPIEAKITAGNQGEVFTLEGPAAIERLTLKLDAKDMDKALRQTILHVICDEYPWGQVQSPVGDFFGAAPGTNPMDTLPFTIAPDGTMTCRFIMPFERSVKIVVEIASRERYEALLRQRGFNDSGESSEAAVAVIASGSIGAGAAVAQDRARTRKRLFTAIVGALALVCGAVGLVMVRRN